MTHMLKLLPATLTAFTLLAPVTSLAEDPANIYYGLQIEEFEYRYGEGGEELFAYDADAFIGTDELKLRWEGDGEYDINVKKFESLSNQLALQTPISDFWDIKGGVRYTSPEGPDRWYGVIGLSGLAPQWIEVDSHLFLSEKGKLSADLDMEYQILLSNYLILTPSASVDVAFSSDREIGVGSGVNSVEAGLRLSYDVWDRAFSPYVGVVYERKFGQTANFIEAEGESADIWYAVIGAKFMF
ncbi:copper resistance protein B [Sneathiella marina]|uniref:Copper resistance protein B n=1 Tax=Sneathiella marina TaxID=2950108 RepID=A0ABY4W2K6_9PROT|nr:copper resistance protein B [Sneathiella marina]USG59554.1 copper resistance protein B [Sneathiella marina]